MKGFDIDFLPSIKQRERRDVIRWIRCNEYLWETEIDCGGFESGEKVMLDNPLAVVEYFRNTLNAIIEKMLKGGMFGELIHYQGPIEYQGRGTPHAHLVVHICVIDNTDGLALD
jgi:Helitron helicase-like domain at N-terminus